MPDWQRRINFRSIDERKSKPCLLKSLPGKKKRKMLLSDPLQETRYEAIVPLDGAGRRRASMRAKAVLRVEWVSSPRIRYMAFSIMTSMSMPSDSALVYRWM
jgi:hypothetical protein